MQHPRLLSRREVREYLATRHGLDIALEQLASWAVKGGGPPFRLLAGRVGKAVYATPDVDAWVDAYLGPLVKRLAEHPAHRREAAA
jgi:hypothetical protein